jgi:ribosomal protein S18 acetylase RimI-like enzyme
MKREPQPCFKNAFAGATIRLLWQAAGTLEQLTGRHVKIQSYISNIEIAPEYQGRGIGTAITNGIIAEARRDGLSVTLRVLKVNPARHLYERLGFIVIKEDETHYYMATK